MYYTVINNESKATNLDLSYKSIGFKKGLQLDFDFNINAWFYNGTEKVSRFNKASQLSLELCALAE